jgi:hypothetical protein
MFGGERVDRGRDPGGIKTFVGLGAGLCHDAIHGLPGYRTALALSRDIREVITAGPCWISFRLNKAVLIPGHQM